MNRSIAGAALVLTVAFAALRVFDPEVRWSETILRGDRVEHAVIVYLLVVFATACFPRLQLWLTSLVLVVIGAALEGAQALFGFGEAQLGDFLADVIGISLAFLPLWVGQGRFLSTVARSSDENGRDWRALIKASEVNQS